MVKNLLTLIKIICKLNLTLLLKFVLHNMSKNNIIKILGVLLTLADILILVFFDVSKFAAVLLGVLLGTGLSLLFSGDETKILGKYIFK